MEELKLGRYKHYKNKEYEVLGVGKFGQHKDSYNFLGIGYHSESLHKIKIFYKDNNFILEGSDKSGLEFVVYMALYDSEEFGKNAFWVRPKKMFIETIDLNGENVPRFKSLE